MEEGRVFTDIKLLRSILKLMGSTKAVDQMYCVRCRECTMNAFPVHTKFRINKGFLEACSEGCPEFCINSGMKNNWHTVFFNFLTIMI